ncbi:MAG: DNA (cytosine-5-)-methyltransferase [Gemmatimonadetes bacterium]|jgi:DNA (cytosine-5)-methyltransferase 1|nr:DNA (cytosine-5-)-methyltransferase [Gemmatimonadota bacterium]
MPDLLLRGLPEDLKDWITEESHSRRMPQGEFTIALVRDAWQTRDQLTLFDHNRPQAADVTSPSVPFSFVDLFAGIGGLRLGLTKAGGRCVFSCEWDKYAQRTYSEWFGEVPADDIRDIEPSSIPDHDVLTAGFPCQPFSIAGVSKKNSLGRVHGFKDATQGTLFFHVASIIDSKRPPIFLLENVKNLKSHDQGKTWKVIESTLDDLDYKVHHKVIDASAWVPQHRERIFIVGLDRRVFGPDHRAFEFPNSPDRSLVFRDILDKRVPEKYTLSDHLWTYLQNYAAKHKAKGNGFGFGMTDLDGISRTLSARYYKDGSEVLIPQSRKKNPRRLTPREAARLMGFPDDLPIVVSDTQAYKQFGNAVVPPVAEAVGRQIARLITDQLVDTSNHCVLKQVTSPAALAVE